MSAPTIGGWTLSRWGREYVRIYGRLVEFWLRPRALFAVLRDLRVSPPIELPARAAAPAGQPRGRPHRRE